MNRSRKCKLATSFSYSDSEIRNNVGASSVSENERREGRIAFLCTLGAKAFSVLGSILGVIFGVRTDGWTGNRDEGYLLGLVLLPFLLIVVTLEVAGVVYGIGGRKTSLGRWGVGLSCLSLGVIITLAWVLGHR